MKTSLLKQMMFAGLASLFLAGAFFTGTLYAVSERDVPQDKKADYNECIESGKATARFRIAEDSRPHEYGESLPPRAGTARSIFTEEEITFDCLKKFAVEKPEPLPGIQQDSDADACFVKCVGELNRQVPNAPVECAVRIQQGSYACPRHAQPGDEPYHTKETDPKKIIKVSGVSRKVQINDPSYGYYALQNGSTLAEGDRIHTGFKASVTLTFPDGSTVVVAPMSMVVIEKVEVDSTKKMHARIWVKLGRVDASVAHPRGPASDFQVKTPTTTASVRGTKFSVDTDGESVQLAVTEGVVHLTPNNTAIAPFDVSAGNSATIGEGAASTTSTTGGGGNTTLWLLGLVLLGVAGGFLSRRK